MATSATAHIAGVGISGLEEKAGSNIDDLAVAAGTKALLDAGVTYGDVDHSVACVLDDKTKISPSTFIAFGQPGSSISAVDNHSGLLTAVQYVRSGQSQCTLVIGLDKDSNSTKVIAAGVVVVSQRFLTSHAYLKDGAVRVRAYTSASRLHSRSQSGSDDARSTKAVVQKALRQAGLRPGDLQLVEVRSDFKLESPRALDGFSVKQGQLSTKSLDSFVGHTGVTGLCGLVWQLRGWAHDRAVSKLQNCMQYAAWENGNSAVVILSRSDGADAPAWKVVENIRDGRERLGYNPAIESRAISKEDLYAVRAMEDFVPDEAERKANLRVKGGDRAALARL